MLGLGQFGDPIMFMHGCKIHKTVQVLKLLGAFHAMHTQWTKTCFPPCHTIVNEMLISLLF